MSATAWPPQNNFLFFCARNLPRAALTHSGTVEQPSLRPSRKAKPPMKFFPNPEKAAEKKVADTRISRDALATRLAAAQGGVVEANVALRQLAVQGADDAALAAGEAKLRASQDRVTTLSAGLIETEQHLATLAAAAADVADRKLRGQTSAAIEAVASDLEDAAKLFEAGASALLEAAKRSSAIISDAVGLETYASGVVIETPPAVAMTAEMLRTHANHVLNSLNDAPAAMPTPAKPFVKVIEAKPPTKSVFTMRHVRWSTPEGNQFRPMYSTIELPLDVADRALQNGFCKPVPGAEWRSFTGTYVRFDAMNAVSLDDKAETEADPAAASPDEPFKPFNRGPSYQLKYAGAK
jgi:hypothetical protein